MSRQDGKGPLSARIYLTIVMFAQIFLTPLVAFTLTYLVDVEFSSEQLGASLRVDMLPWIIAASLSYGLLALGLALVMGGYSPMWVVNRGGWVSALGFTRNQKAADKLRNARLSFAKSPHGKLSVLVHDRYSSGKHKIISTHGGLTLLAVPFQVFLITVPLATVVAIPDHYINQDRQLELAFILYLICLVVVMKMFPIFARKYIGIAAFTRRLLVSMTRLSWLAPLFVLWLLGRIASLVVLGWLGEDIDLTLHLEQVIFESLLFDAVVPQTSFLDLMTALAVIPLSAFTTLATLGGGSARPPKWMRINNLDTDEEIEQERLARNEFFDNIGKITGGGLTAAIGGVVASGIAPISTNLSKAAIAQKANEILNNKLESKISGFSETVSQTEDLDFSGINEVQENIRQEVTPERMETGSRWADALIEADSVTEHVENLDKIKPKFDEPVIRGFDLD